jgi:AcrR family transcriptional regulator
MAFSPTLRADEAAILAAARRRFAADGFERTTIRAIAADAGIDPSMVMRYYGSKDGLFSAAADLDLQLPDLAAVPREQLGETLRRHWVARWEGGRSDEFADRPLSRRSRTRRLPSDYETFSARRSRRRRHHRGRSRRGGDAGRARVDADARPRPVPAHPPLPPVVALDLDLLIATVSDTCSATSPARSPLEPGDANAGLTRSAGT